MTNGYVEVWLESSSPFFPMAAKDGYVYEHRLVMAQHLGRCLDTTEHVHHKNRDKHDNRIENLELLAKDQHIKEHWESVKRLEEENKELKRRLAEYEQT